MLSHPNYSHKTESVTTMRLTKNNIKNMFNELGLKPKRNSLYQIKDGQKCACLIGALYFKENNIEPPVVNKNEEFVLRVKINNWADKKYGHKQMWEMISSFDYPMSEDVIPAIAQASMELIN